MESNDQNIPQEPAQSPQQDPGFYHGTGAGQQEQIHTGAPYVTYHYGQPQPNQPWDQGPWQQPQAPQAPRTSAAKKRKKSLVRARRAFVAMCVAIALAAGGAVSAWWTGRYWKNQLSLMDQRYSERLQVLQEQLENPQVPGAPGGELAPSGPQLSASEIYQRNVGSVLAITATVRSTNNFGQITEYTSSGSGFVLTEDGYIVTNHHVIEGANKVTVTMHDGSSYAAKVIGSDATNDVALLKASVQGWTPVTLGSSSALQVGDSVVAIGNALGELAFSLTVGYVSGMDRDIATDGSVINMLQTDAAINSGNSGGPLFNARGEVIGITTAKYSGTTSSGASIEGISFAIPMDDVTGMLADLMEFGYIRSAYLGVMVRDMDPDVCAAYGLPLGVYVEEVTAGNCAEKAGVVAKDIIIGLGGYEIENMSDLSRALRAYHGGETVTITVWRGGREVILQITLDVKSGT